MRRSATILLVAVMAFGCTSGPQWTRRTFAFSPPADPPPTQASTNLVSLSRLSISPLFQSRSFTYRTSENSYKQDPYAGFLVSPERALAEAIRAWMRASGAFGRVVEPGSRLVPNRLVEVSVTELYGDFHRTPQPVGTMQIRFISYEVNDATPGRIVLDIVCSRETPLASKTPDALVAAWGADLQAIMQEISSEYAKADSSTH